QAGSDGILFSVDGDGGVSPTSGTTRDFGLFRGGGAAAAPVLMTTNNTTFGPAALLGDQFDNANAGFTTLFPSLAFYGTTPGGSAGLAWIRGEVRQETNVVTWIFNDTIVAQFTNNTGFGSGDIMLGYYDAFASLGDTADFAIFDNIVVTNL